MGTAKRVDTEIYFNQLLATCQLPVLFLCTLTVLGPIFWLGFPLNNFAFNVRDLKKEYMFALVLPF